MFIEVFEIIKRAYEPWKWAKYEHGRKSWQAKRERREFFASFAQAWKQAKWEARNKWENLT